MDAFVQIRGCALAALAVLAVATQAATTRADALSINGAVAALRGGDARPVTVDYRSFRQRYYDPYATPYFYAPPTYRYGVPPRDYEGPPVVYGWAPPPRPTSCGRFFYWDGVRCIDARRRPPYVGPR